MRRRILVVDDEPGMLRAVRRVLERQHDVLCASSADEASSGFAEFRPDLAILDIRMPGRDGFELMAELKQRDPGLDVILMTGSVDESDRKLVQAIRQNAFYFIHKPFDREVLQSLVARCLQQRELSETNRRQVRRLENVLAEARAFQSSLFPRERARFDSVEVEGRHVSCDELCGDIYDYSPAGPGVLAFIVADVSGHGASAAMLTGVVKAAFRSCTTETYEPLAVVKRIAAGLGTFRASRFVTLFCGRLDSARQVLDYVNAGHPPGLFWGPGSELELLGPTGPIVSPALDAVTWRQERRTMAARERLLLHTDGVTEAQDETGFYGDERLARVVARVPAGGRELVDAILEDVESFTQGRRATDDLTLLAVSCR